MLTKTERKVLNFVSFPSIIRDMSENNSEAAAIIDELIELKGESNTLATLIMLDDMNIRGIQIYNLYKMCNKNIDEFYNKVIGITKDDIKTLNELSAPLCVYKAIFEGTSLDRTNNPNKYVFTGIEREIYTAHKSKKQNTVENDLHPSIEEEIALKILQNNGFTCGYQEEFINNKHQKEIYRIFYNDLGDIIFINSSDNKFLNKNSKLYATRQKDHENICYMIELKDHPFKTYKEFLNKYPSPSYDINLLPIIKTSKGIIYKEKYPSYNSCITTKIYDLLSFDKVYKKLDDGLKKIYQPLLGAANDRAYDEIVNYLLTDDGIKIATDLQNILGANLSKSKLLAAKDRFCNAHGHKPNNKPKRFLSRLISDDPYTKDMNNRMIEVLNKDIETV